MVCGDHPELSKKNRHPAAIKKYLGSDRLHKGSDLLINGKLTQLNTVLTSLIVIQYVDMLGKPITKLSAVCTLVICLSGLACVKKPETMVGPTIGKLHIMSDTTLKYIIEQEEEIFERTYKYADVSITYAPEMDVMEAFMADSVDAVIVTRRLTQDEKDFFISRKNIPREYAFATGALAFISQKNPKDTAFTYEVMLDAWKNKDHGKIFVIENPRSGIAQEIMHLIDTTALPSHFYALKSKAEVIHYVTANENAIGIIDWSDFSDSDNPMAKEILDSVYLIGVSRPADSTQYGMLRPYQYNLQDRKYPFTRDLYFISTTGRTDVGLGFASFIAGEIGQKIILKAGLLPKYQSERIIEMGTQTDVKVVK